MSIDTIQLSTLDRFEMSSRRGVVTIETTENGWRIIGTPHPRSDLAGQYQDQHLAFGRYRAEVTRCDCGIENPRRPTAAERLTQSRAMTLNARHRALNDDVVGPYLAGDLIPLPPAAHIERGACDQMGHLPRVVELAERVLKTY